MTDSADSLTTTTRRPNEFHLVNLHQSSEETRGKYWLLISFGISWRRAKQMRDWRLSKIERFLGIEETYNPSTQSYARQLNIP